MDNFDYLDNLDYPDFPKSNDLWEKNIIFPQNNNEWKINSDKFNSWITKKFKINYDKRNRFNLNYPLNHLKKYYSLTFYNFH